MNKSNNILEQLNELTWIVRAYNNKTQADADGQYLKERLIHPDIQIMGADFHDGKNLVVVIVKSAEKERACLTVWQDAPYTDQGALWRLRDAEKLLLFAEWRKMPVTRPDKDYSFIGALCESEEQANTLNQQLKKSPLPMFGGSIGAIGTMKANGVEEWHIAAICDDLESFAVLGAWLMVIAGNIDYRPSRAEKDTLIEVHEKGSDSKGLQSYHGVPDENGKFKLSEVPYPNR